MPFASPGQSIVTRGKRRVVIGSGASLTKTYADFLAHITALGAGGSVAWGNQFPGVSSYISTADNATALGGMTGTTWMGSFKFDATTAARAIQHAMPTQAAWQEQRDLGRTVLIKVESSSVDSFSSLNRNGFSSSASADTFGPRRSSQLLFWSGTDTGGSAFSMNPNAGLGPTPYTWKTYADFQAHIAALATGGSVLWGAGEGAQNLGAGKYRTTAAAVSGTHVMRGSSWTQAYQNGGTISRVVQHSSPSPQAVFDAIVAAGGEVYFELAVAAPQTSAARDRNGYLSLDVPTAVANRTVVDFIYWDGTKAMQMNPFTGTGPTPYTW